MSQKKIGVVITYINMVMNMLVDLVVTPLLIISLTDTDYSIYKIIQSFASPLIMFNLGVSVIVTKYIVSYEDGTIKDKKVKENALAMSILATFVMTVVIIIACIIMRMSIPSIYGATFSDAEIVVAQKIFMIFAVAIIFQVLSETFLGIILGHKKYVVHASISLIKNILRIVLTAIMLILGFGVVFLSSINLVITFSCFAVVVFYSLCCLKEKPKFYYFDKSQMKEILSYSIAILLQAVVNQVNNSVDNMVLGAMIAEKYIITMYSSALTIYTVYNSLISTISNYFLPSAINLVNTKPSGKEYTGFVVRPGRIQAVIAVSILCCFSLFGKDFISLWIGEKYIDAYYVVLLLIVPVTIPLVENSAIAILDATLKRKARSFILAIMAGLNVILTITLVKMIGFWGAAISTSLSLIIGHGFLMNFYYHRTYQMQIVKMFVSIFKGILPCGIISGVICYFVTQFFPNGYFGLVTKCAFFMLLYIALLWKWGLSTDDKAIVGAFRGRK